jgi:hypothetical protein
MPRVRRLRHLYLYWEGYTNAGYLVAQTAVFRTVGPNFWEQVFPLSLNKNKFSSFSLTQQRPPDNNGWQVIPEF